MFAEALAEVISRLDRVRTAGQIEAYALIGGMAVSAWGIPRATHDLDFAVALTATDPRTVADALKGTYKPGDPDDPLRAVIHVLISTAEPPVPVQLVVFPPPWPSILFNHVENLNVFGSSVPVVSWQALLMLKLYAAGPADLLDAQEIWKVCQPDFQAVQNLRELARKLKLTGDFERFLKAVTS